MRKIFCDLCEKEANDVVKVTIKDGESYHNGDHEYSSVDVCFRCIKREDLKLRSYTEMDSIKSRIRQGK